MNNDPILTQAARTLEQASRLVISAGAGMGVDSGLPDFRGPEGFWRAYPALRARDLSFRDIATPRTFEHQPELAWGFYGHRLELYRTCTPHNGFHILRRWARTRSCHILTTNVDGAFQRTGWPEESVYEIHGSLHWLQCHARCTDAIWSADDTHLTIDADRAAAQPPLPRCPECGGIARPNVMMFQDFCFNRARANAQLERSEAWFAEDSGGGVVLEIGAGHAIPTLRKRSQRLQARGYTLIRINPDEPEGPEGTLSLSMGALAALEALDQRMERP